MDADSPATGDDMLKISWLKLLLGSHLREQCDRALSLSFAFQSRTRTTRLDIKLRFGSPRHPLHVGPHHTKKSSVMVVQLQPLGRHHCNVPPKGTFDSLPSISLRSRPANVQ